MKRPLSFCAAVLLTALASGTALPAEGMAELDCAAKPRLLDSHFGRYGHEPKTCIIRERDALHFLLPAAEGVPQTGLYSYVALAGDFEVSAAYEWDEVPAPEGGYGVSCGIAVESVHSGLSVSLARGHLAGKGEGQGQAYVVSRGRPGDKGTHYETSTFPTWTKNGRLVLRRQKDELICLTANTLQAEPGELCRMPFTEDTVRPVRFFADTGGSPTGVEARLSQIKLRAAEVAAGLVQHEQSSDPTGWLIAGVIFLTVTVLLVVRYKQAKWPFAEAD